MLREFCLLCINDLILNTINLNALNIFFYHAIVKTAPMHRHTYPVRMRNNELRRIIRTLFPSLGNEVRVVVATLYVLNHRYIVRRLIGAMGHFIAPHVRSDEIHRSLSAICMHRTCM